MFFPWASIDVVFAMEVDVSASSSTTSCSFSKVISPSLNSTKHWYVLTKNICGCRPTDFAKNEVFRQFPGEIQLMETRELKAANEGCSLNRQPRNLYVATSFGFCASLLRQREFPQNGFIRSAEFSSVQNSIICVKLDLKSLGGKNFNFGASQNSAMQDIDAQLLDWKAHFHAAHQEMLQLRKTISELEEVIVELQRDSTSSVDHCTPDRDITSDEGNLRTYTS